VRLVLKRVTLSSKYAPLSYFRSVSNASHWRGRKIEEEARGGCRTDRKPVPSEFVVEKETVKFLFRSLEEGPGLYFPGLTNMSLEPVSTRRERFSPLQSTYHHPVLVPFFF
jgi:hypothetical protein